MNKILFKGIMPAMPTPIDENERLIAPTVKKLMDYQYRAGIHGFYVGGATGEGPVLPVSTRMALCETAVEANENRGKLILQIGGPNFTDVKALIKHANTTSVDALSAMAPNAYFPHSDRELVEYYKRLASLTDKPILIYVTKLMLGNNLQTLFTDLMQVKNIIGLKFTLPNYYLLSLLKMVNGGNINVINGPDEMLISGLAMGADGGIGTTYNIMPEKYVALYNAFTNGEIEKARALQYEINRIVRVLLTVGDGAAALKNTKLALNLAGFEMGNCAFPSTATAEDAKHLLDELHTAGWNLV